jgi:hypothetical protein
MKVVLYFLNEIHTLNKDTHLESLYLAQKVRDTYNCNVDLVIYERNHVVVRSWKKNETYYPYSRERLERNGK